MYAFTFGIHTFYYCRKSTEQNYFHFLFFPAFSFLLTPQDCVYFSFAEQAAQCFTDIHMQLTLVITKLVCIKKTESIAWHLSCMTLLAPSQTHINPTNKFHGHFAYQQGNLFTS